MSRLIAAALVALLPLAAPADDAKAKKPVGTWVREVEGSKIVFEIKADAVITKLTPGGGATGTIESSYTFSDDGVLVGTITKVDANGNDGLPTPGDKFSFKVKIDKDKMTLSELKLNGNDAEGGAKQLVEGEYKKEK